jgi:tetratricopeptide (TPR) repeat protein
MIFRNPYFYFLSASFVVVLLILYLMELIPFRYLLLFIVFSTFLCGFLVYLIEATLSSFFSGGIELGRKSEDENLHEKFSADMEKARHSKRRDRFPEALKSVNVVLSEIPDYPEALYLKAQILWEGFGNYAQTLKYLNKVLQLVSEKEGLHRWATTYYNEVKDSHLLEEKKHDSNHD